MKPDAPPHLDLTDLAERARRAVALLDRCRLCPRKCDVDRLSGEHGFCRTGRRAIVASYDAHFGEESPLVGQNGSGTIFFANCNLGCRFCQNYAISHGGEGDPVDDADLAAIMLALQTHGCHNINLVSPTHVVPQIISALVSAKSKGLTIPVVYNCGGYERVRTLQLLDGLVDIYMPDFKFWDDAIAARLCCADHYRQAACEALMEMHRQVGDLDTDEGGIATRGLLVRHLVMPDRLADTVAIMKFIADHISPDTYVNIMPQYRPMGDLTEDAQFNRPITEEEFTAALNAANTAGIHRLDKPLRIFNLR